MITEDYVNFETAKLLKEKGFDGICGTAYETITNEHAVEQSAISEWGKLCQAKRPTLQMTMKWLREEHKIAINIGWGEVFEKNYQWWCIILNQNSGEILRENEYHKTYEEAAEAAIKYCLENLI